MTLGLQYLDSTDVPDDLPVDDDKNLFRFANIDVFEVKKSGEKERGRFRKMLSQPEKIELSDLEFIGDARVFILACRDRLLANIDDSSRQKLFEIEQQMLAKLQAEEIQRR
jgi:hypothetical protein